MKNQVTKEKLEKYFSVTEKALSIARNKIVKGKETKAKEIISMADNYISDAKFFQNKEDLVNAFAALNYAHGWIDSGARLGIFNVKDNKLFVIK